jgi:surfeit locus 1 family protein
MGGSGKGGQYIDSNGDMNRFPAARRFRPGVPATLFAGFFLPVLLGLGTWQLDRAAQKRELFASFAAGAGKPLALADHPRGLDSLRRFTRVAADGRYRADRQFLLDNMVEDQQAGFRVLTPLVLDDGRAVMVDRGWVPKAFGSHASLPEVAVDTSRRSVTGRLDRLPRPGIDLDRPPGEGWPRVVQFPSADELSAALGMELVPGVILLDPESPDGFRRNWRPSDFGPERHVGYAVQWFSLAGTLVVLYLVWALRKSD